ncbi:hypothetical protein TNCV_5049341 [Trichonephila clavipes]|nr:hypothetical protein TNCV_5049341 [Trichonephila clavipes]
MGSIPETAMDVWKCIVPVRHGIESLLKRLVVGEERWETPDLPRVFSLKIEVEASQKELSPVWCSKLRLTIDVKLFLCHDEFVRPLPDTIDQVASEATLPQH